MVTEVADLIADLDSKNDVVRKGTLDRLMTMTETRVDWIYDHLDALCAKLNSDNSYQRNIGAMLIASLAKSDDQGRIAAMLGGFITQMNDEKFITARITLQAAGRLGRANEAYAIRVAAGLIDTMRHSRHLSTHGNLIRLDAVASLREILTAYSNAADIEAARMAIAESCDAKEAAKLLLLLAL